MEITGRPNQEDVDSIHNKFVQRIDIIAGKIDRGVEDEFDVRDFLDFKPYIKNWEKLEDAVEEENHDGESDLWDEIEFIDGEKDEDYEEPPRKRRSGRPSKRTCLLRK